MRHSTLHTSKIAYLFGLQLELDVGLLYVENAALVKSKMNLDALGLSLAVLGISLGHTANFDGGQLLLGNMLNLRLCQEREGLVLDVERECILELAEGQRLHFVELRCQQQRIRMRPSFGGFG